MKTSHSSLLLILLLLAAVSSPSLASWRPGRVSPANLPLRERGFFRSAQPPVMAGIEVTWLPVKGGDPRSDGTAHVTVTGRVLTAAGGLPLGTLTCTYEIRPNAEIRVSWTLDWTAPETHLWEAGLKLSVPAAWKVMEWQRDSYFTGYPAGHIGEPAGTCYAGDGLFRATKRGLHWLTLTDGTGTGLGLLEADLPLSARGEVQPTGAILLASREVAGPRDFSGSWVADHDIVARQGKPLSGGFVLRAIAP